MKFTMAPLLAHSEHVPESSRAALRAAMAATDEDRRVLLASAARTLHHETGLACSDALELVGLDGGTCA